MNNKECLFSQKYRLFSQNSRLNGTSARGNKKDLSLHILLTLIYKHLLINNLLALKDIHKSVMNLIPLLNRLFVVNYFLFSSQMGRATFSLKSNIIAQFSFTSKIWNFNV